MAEHPLTLAARFGLELALLGIYGRWGWQTGHGPLAFVLAIGMPLLVAIIWGAIVSPKAALATPGIVQIAVETALFAGATWMLVSLGAPVGAAWLFGVWLLQTLVSYDRIARLLGA